MTKKIDFTPMHKYTEEVTSEKAGKKRYINEFLSKDFFSTYFSK